MDHSLQPNSVNQIVEPEPGIDWPRALDVELRAVEPIKGYYPSLAGCTEDQKQFYREWKLEYDNGQPYLAPIGFLFIHCYDIVLNHWNRWNECAWELGKLSYAYEFVESKVSNYALRWCADACVAAGDYTKAIFLLRKGFKPGTHALNEMFNLRLLSNMKMDEVELLRQAQLGATYNLSKFALENIREVAVEARKLLDFFEQQRNIDLLRYIAEKYPEERKYGVSLFNGIDLGLLKIPHIDSFCFYAIPEFDELAGVIARQAENLVRGRYGKRLLAYNDQNHKSHQE